MSPRSSFVPLAAPLLSLLIAGCGQSNGSEKKGGHPGMGMPPPEVAVVEVKPQSLPLQFEYPGQTAGSREAEVLAAQARYDQAKRNAARLKPLYAEKAVSQKEYDDAVSAEEIGAADVKAARARLVEAKLNLNYTRVEAPISGVASRSLRSEGSLAEGPQTLLTTVI